MHRPQQRVTDFGPELRALVADMSATMYAADGVGLAACQIGVDLQVFVFDCPDDDGRSVRGVVCNPVLELPEGKERRLDDSDEGCLSFPGAFVPCARPDYAEVRGQGLDGEDVHYSGTGLLARCLQHETDHCLGTVFGDRLNRRNYKKLAKQMEAAAADYPPGWPASAEA
jgi:peptide deformylase